MAAVGGETNVSITGNAYPGWGSYDFGVAVHNLSYSGLGNGFSWNNIHASGYTFYSVPFYLLPINTILSSDQMVNIYFQMVSTANSQIPVGGNTVVVDSYNSAQVEGLQVPNGVTWSSDSGVFLSAVPVPGTIWLFSSTLAVLAWFNRRKSS